MTARPSLGSIPAAGITVDGIVDVLGGKSIVVPREVGATGADALKGQVLELDGAGKVQMATQDVAIADVAGIAVSSALTGEIISVLRQGVARLVVDGGSSALAIGDEVAVLGTEGKVGKLGDDSTANAIGYVSALDISGGAYVDVEINQLGQAV